MALGEGGFQVNELTNDFRGVHFWEGNLHCNAGNQGKKNVHVALDTKKSIYN